MDHETPQQQAELLLERAVNHYEGANDQIVARVESWWGKLKLTPHFNSLITTALNSNDLRVRAAGYRVGPGRDGCGQGAGDRGEVGAQAADRSPGERVWALWELGLLGNRGVVPERVNEIFVANCRTPILKFAIGRSKGLAYLGTNETIAPLLQEFHDDPSPMVRERAGCSLAQSGMLTQEQRHSVIPRLLIMPTTRLLTRRPMAGSIKPFATSPERTCPSDSIAWRNWYSTTAEANPLVFCFRFLVSSLIIPKTLHQKPETSLLLLRHLRHVHIKVGLWQQ